MRRGRNGYNGCNGCNESNECDACGGCVVRRVRRKREYPPPTRRASIAAGVDDTPPSFLVKWRGTHAHAHAPRRRVQEAAGFLRREFAARKGCRGGVGGMACVATGTNASMSSTATTSYPARSRSLPTPPDRPALRKLHLGVLSHATARSEQSPQLPRARADPARARATPRRVRRPPAAQQLHQARQVAGLQGA